MANEKLEHGNKLGALPLVHSLVRIRSERRSNGKEKHDDDANEKGNANNECDRVLGARDTGKLDPAIRAITRRAHAAQGAHVASRARRSYLANRHIGRPWARRLPLALDKFSPRPNPLDAPKPRHDAQGRVVAACAHAARWTLETLLLLPGQVAGEKLARHTGVQNIVRKLRRSPIPVAKHGCNDGCIRCWRETVEHCGAGKLGIDQIPLAHALGYDPHQDGTRLLVDRRLVRQGSPIGRDEDSKRVDIEPAILVHNAPLERNGRVFAGRTRSSHTLDTAADINDCRTLAFHRSSYLDRRKR